MSKHILLRLVEVILLFMLIIPCGCGHRYFYKPDSANRYYVPEQIPIKPGTILKPEFNLCKAVNIINVQTNTDNILIGAYTHKWRANLGIWTDTAVGLAQNELKKRGVSITVDAPKILRLSITSAKLDWRFRFVGCELILNVETGNGDVIWIKESNSSIDLFDSCDGAVTKAVTAMFNDDKILRYLAAPVKPKDSDCDGVPDNVDECPETPLRVMVDSKGCPLDTDRDGVPDYKDKCPDTPQGVKVDEKGCPLDTDRDGVPDYKDKCPGTPKGPKGSKVDSDGCWVINEALFDFDRDEIKPQYCQVIDEVVAVLKNNPCLKIVIEGHTDNSGSKEYNEKLSQKRAEAVMRYLLKMGIEKKRLSAVGYGFSRPAASNKTEAGRALNRRVKFVPVN